VVVADIGWFASTATIDRHQSGGRLNNKWGRKVMRHLETARVAAVLILSTLPCIAVAQELCVEVLRSSARDYTVEIQEDTMGRVMYDNYCHNKQVKAGISTAGTAAFPIEGIPFKFGGSASSNKEKLDNLCKSFGEQLEVNSFKYKYENLASNKAIDAWKDCMLFASQQKVRVKPHVTPLRVALNIEKTGADPVTITSIEQEGLDCTATDDESPQRKSITEFKSKILSSSQQWQILCKRIRMQAPDGFDIQSAEIAIGTGAGYFAFIVPPERSFSPATASDLRAQIDGVRSSLSNFEQQVDGMIGWVAKDPNNAKDGCFKIKTMQICYGTVKTSYTAEYLVPPSGAMRRVRFEFPRPFASPPVISSTFGATTMIPTADFMGIVHKARVDARGAEYILHDRLNANYTPDLHFDYVAIGTHQ
jgi:hypothetical protein